MTPSNGHGEQPHGTGTRLAALARAERVAAAESLALAAPPQAAGVLAGVAAHKRALHRLLRGGVRGDGSPYSQIIREARGTGR